jgi:hypothetical protein
MTMLCFKHHLTWEGFKGQILYFKLVLTFLDSSRAVNFVSTLSTNTL